MVAPAAIPNVAVADVGVDTLILLTEIPAPGLIDIPVAKPDPVILTETFLPSGPSDGLILVSEGRSTTVNGSDPVVPPAAVTVMLRGPNDACLLYTSDAADERSSV